MKGKKLEKIRLKLKAYDHRVLDRSVASIVEAVDISKNISWLKKELQLLVTKLQHFKQKYRKTDVEKRLRFKIRVYSKMLEVLTFQKAA